MTKLVGKIEDSNLQINVKMLGSGPKGEKGEKGEKGDKGEQGLPGLDGKSLEFHWNGTQLGIRIEGETTYQYVDLKGEKGDKGDNGEDGYTPIKGIDYFDGKDGKSLEFHWNGTQLGIRKEGETTYQYVNLKGDKGDKGDQGIPGKNLEFNWNGTQLGIRQEGQSNYTYVDLKGAKGDKGDKGDTGNTGATGKSIEFHWNGTSLGIRQEGQSSYQYVNLKGEKGDKGDKGDKGEPGDIENLTSQHVTTALGYTPISPTQLNNKVQTDVPVNAKFTDTVTTINGKTGAISKDDIVALGIPAQDTTYSEITTAEIDTGTASTLRTITARRLKYLLDKIVALFPSKTSQLTNDSGFLTSVSKADVGLGNVDNTSDLNKPISTAMQTALDSKVDNSRVLTDVPLNAKFTDTITTINGKTGTILKADIVALGIPAQDTVYTHPGSGTNPHGTTKADVGLGNVDNVKQASKTEFDEHDNDDTRHITSVERTKWNAVDNKVDKVTGKGLSTNDYTTAEKNKLAGIEAGAQVNTVTSVAGKTGAVTVSKSDVGLGNVDNVKQMPISGGVLENYREKLISLSGTSVTINLNNGNVFTHTLSGNTTYTISNAVSGQAHSFTLIITQTATVRTITFPASIKWQDGDIPDMITANKTYVLTFVTVNGGTTWLGMFGGEF
jgi:hypothetical protein